MECSDVSTDCFGVMFAYQGTGSASPYTDAFAYIYQLTSGGTVTSIAVDMVTGTL
jgi:hypothetical protein